MTDSRPHQGELPARLLDKKRDLQRDIKYWDGQQKAFLRNWSGDRFYATRNEEYQSMSNEIRKLGLQIAEIERELDLQRDERQAARLAREAQKEKQKLSPNRGSAAASSDAGRSGEAAHHAFAVWASTVGVDLPSYSTTRVDLEWTDGDRQYIGMFYPGDGKLVVWMGVAKGTPGAKLIKNIPCLRADNREQVRQAQEIERRSR